jgi:ribosome maturation protein Sdo1
VIVASGDAVSKYRKDSSTPLVDVVDSFDIFVTNKHGSQGVLNRASAGQIENEFGTYPANVRVADERTKNEEALETILKEGKVEQTKAAPKFGMIPLKWELLILRLYE